MLSPLLTSTAPPPPLPPQMWREDISGLGFTAAIEVLNPLPPLPPPKMGSRKCPVLLGQPATTALSHTAAPPPTPLPSALPFPLNTKPPRRCGGRTSQAWVSQLPINFLKEYGFDEGGTSHAPSHEH
jgi:hypothetical protein